MLFSWFQNRRRRRITQVPFPEEWESVLSRNVLHFQYLTAAQQIQLKEFVQIFVAEKHWEGVDGFEITPEVQVTTAAQAGLLALGSTQTFFEHVLSILVYPGEYERKQQTQNSDGIVTEHRLQMLGEAEWRGPVYLSWPDVLEGGRRRSVGHNLVLHEFAHQMDMLNGRFVDGIPPLNSRSELQRWLSICELEHKALVERCRRREPGIIDCYGAQNAAEFFAVLTEAFFENSLALQQHHPDSYGLLSDYFQLDPAAWAE